jgi:tRNA-dihydrouridine synthase
MGSDQPLIAHIWGKNPENFYKTAQQIVSGELGNFVGIDLNMGCPVKNVVGHGTCSALINDRPLAHEIIEATRKGLDGKLPLSVKTRLGFSTVDLTWHEFLLGHNLDMLTIHGRTRAQMSKVPADWDKIGEIRALRDKLAPETLIVGNGDVMNRQQGIELAERYGLDGIMIGRGIFHDPFAFAADSPWETIAEQERVQLYKRHVELFKATWQEGERPIHTLNKFCKIYINGFDGAKEFREELMAADSTDELLVMLDEHAAVTVNS